MRTRGVKEMPLYDFSDKLGLYSRNADSTDRFLTKGVEPFTLSGLPLPSGYCLVKSLIEKQYRIITSSDGKPYTAYAVKLITDNEIDVPHTAATHVMVWRTPSLIHKRVIDGFPQRFFTWLLDEYSIVVSDSEQTGDRQRFWLTMLDWAFAATITFTLPMELRGKTGLKHTSTPLQNWKIAGCNMRGAMTARYTHTAA